MLNIFYMPQECPRMGARLGAASGPMIFLIWVVLVSFLSAGKRNVYTL